MSWSAILNLVLFPISPNEQRQFRHQHTDPASQIGEWQSLDAKVHDQNQRSGSQNPDAHVDKAADQGNLQIADTAEEALDSVGNAGRMYITEIRCR